MYSKIVLAFDGSDCSRQAAAAALNLAARCGAELIAITVVNIPDFAGSRGEIDEEIELAKRSLAPAITELKTEASTLGVTLDHRLLYGHPGNTIVETAQKEKADLLVVGSHGRSGIEKALLGSVSSFVVTHAPCPVLIVKSCLSLQQA